MIKFNCEHGKPSYATCQECMSVDLAGTGEPFVIETTGDAMKVMESMTTNDKEKWDYRNDLTCSHGVHLRMDCDQCDTEPPTKDWEEKLRVISNQDQHEYCDSQWERIKSFIQEVEKQAEYCCGYEPERGYERGRKEGQMEGYTDGLKEGVKDRATYDRYADEGTLGNSKKETLTQLRTIIEGKKKDLLDECRECSEEKGHFGNTCGNYYAALQDILEEINKLENE